MISFQLAFTKVKYILKKLAIFVEGQTEQIFVHRLINEIAGKKNLKVRLDKLNGGAKSPRIISQVKIVDSEDKAKYFVLIRDSATDSRVVSDVKDNTVNLKDSGYDRIIGLRDLYPLPIEKLERVISSTNRAVSSEILPCNIVIAVREIETWFLAEHSHFAQIDSELDLAKIFSELNLDLESIHVEDIEHPSQTLHAAYNLVGKAYTKNKKHVERTIDALDYENIYLQLIDNLNSLKQLVDDIDSFLVET